MDMISSAKWVSDFEMEDPTFINQYEMSALDYSLDELNFQSFSSESYSSYPNFTPKADNFSKASIENLHQMSGNHERPAKQPKNNTSSWNSCSTDHIITANASSSSSSYLISFENSNSSPPTTSQQYYGLDCRVIKPKNEVEYSNGKLNPPALISQGIYDPQTCSPKHGQGIKRAATVTRSPLDAQDHVLAERKRRENLSQRFIALSALLPGLKKTDKASVLGDAIKYVKHLQELTKMLEKQAAKKTVEAVVFVKRTQYSADDDISSSDENSESCSNQPLPEIEARVSDKEVLIRIHSEKTKGCLASILSEIEKLDLTIVHSCALPLGNSTLDITVVAQMDVEFSMTVKDLVKNLRQALLKLVGPET
ncbi:transcription factor bHLH18 [Pyrus x bretschneideri]|uniref:transcription factor bHLH18 n=1 Tax=Pyrus x bretschneideri TaxID=225117 RepID=UPI00202F975F|nr:transcription factor bHLH18 [Pyrus x bretschneideri]XP_048438062.1 transcription factor bHLH18 [Pyrus x bretschneideri]